MTDRQPSLDAVREPGFYWVRWPGLSWAVAQWADNGWWYPGRDKGPDDPAEIGPRIPDVATLQQHERLKEERDAETFRAKSANEALHAVMQEKERAMTALREPSDAAVLAAAKACCCPSGKCAADCEAPAMYCQCGKYLPGMRAALVAALDAAETETGPVTNA